MATVKKTQTPKPQSVFEKLSAINVNKHVEKKQNLTYLSWAYAWAEVKKACPDARYEIVKSEDDNGKLVSYEYDKDLGFLCHTIVTIEDESLEMWLPVMDGANKSMKKVAYKYTSRFGEKNVAAASSFDINKTLMRCLVKNLAMFGMGIYIYAGEDMPIVDEPVVNVPTPKAKTKQTKDLITPSHARWGGLLSFAKTNKIVGFKKLVTLLEESGDCKLSDDAKEQIKELTITKK